MGALSTPTISLANARGRRGAWVAPIMICAVVILLAALWSGLVHLGLPLPRGGDSLNKGHGPMMILGFLGTLISLQHAAAVKNPRRIPASHSFFMLLKSQVTRLSPQIRDGKIELPNDADLEKFVDWKAVQRLQF